MKPVLILCLGNEVLCDDALGAFVAMELKPLYGKSREVEVLFAPLAGFHLIDHLNKRSRVLIVDSIMTGKVEPGEIMFFPSGYLIPSNGLINSHQINLPTAIELGIKLGYEMPKDIDILAVEISDNTTLSETMTKEISDMVRPVTEKVIEWIDKKTLQTSHCFC